MDLVTLLQQVITQVAQSMPRAGKVIENVGHECRLCGGISMARCTKCARQVCLRHCLFRVSLTPRPRATPECSYCILAGDPEIFRFDGDPTPSASTQPDDVLDAEYEDTTQQR